MNLEDEIQEVLTYEKTVRTWRNDFNSNEYKLASKLNNVFFGMPLNKQKNCDCVNDFFLLLKHKNINQKIKQMENKFKLRNGILVQSHAIGNPVNNNNITDAISIKLLKSNKANIVLFESYPENWEYLVDGKKAKEISKQEEEVKSTSKKRK